MYLQSIHLTRLLSRLITVKPQQSEWLFTWLLSAECGSSLNSSRVASANLVLYPIIIPGLHSPTLQSVHRLLLQAGQVLQIQLQQSKEGALHQVGRGLTLIHCLCLLSWHKLRKGTKCLDHCILSNFKKFKCGKLFRK